MLDLEQLMVDNMKVMKDIIESGRPPLPMAFVVSKDEEISIGIVDPSFMQDEQSKDHLSAILLEKCKEETTLCVIFMAAAWTKIGRPKKHISLQNDPERREGIVAQLMAVGSPTSAVIWRYKTENGKAIFEEAPEFPTKFSEVEARFSCAGVVANA